MSKPILNIVDEIGRALLFFKQIIKTTVKTPCSWKSVCEQVVKITYQSLPTTALAGFFVGAIMTVQFSMQVKEFGALGFLGGLATSGTIREVGPLLIAFMLSGKVGAYTSAELGTMRVTEQIDAIRCLGANPLQEIILPRFFGIIISSFLLLSAGLLTSISGGVTLGFYFADIHPQEYIRHIPTIVTAYSVGSGLFKCLVFSIVLALICTYKGFHASGGSKGVGQAVVATAVATMVGIVVADWFTSLLSDVALTIWLGV